MRDPKFMALFVYAPHALLDPDDSERLRAVKLELLILRKRMWRVVGLAMALVTIGFFLEIFWHIFSGVWWEE